MSMTVPTDRIPIRAADLRDLDTVVEFHVRIWRQTYRDLAPKHAFDALSEARRRPMWEATLSSQTTGQETLIATDQNRIAGLLCFGPATDRAFEGAGEVKHLYVDPKFGRKGLGTRLLAIAKDRLSACGTKRMALAVVRGNRSARDFYNALGGRETGQFLDQGPLWKSDNVIVSWNLADPSSM